MTARAFAYRRAFAYDRAIAPMMWVLVGLSSIELIVVHALLAFWHPVVALVTSLATLGGIVWLVATIRSFRYLPVIVEADGVVMRVGRLKAIRIPAAEIAGLRATWDAQTVRQRDVLNLALVAYPNVMLDLRVPQRFRRRAVVAVAHRLDDAAGFADAIDALGLRND